jgi:hypothetical protein
MVLDILDPATIEGIVEKFITEMIEDAQITA